MITLDQALLLQKKVETAVAKINSLNLKVAQLESENDALRSKCAELTKAFSEKSELVNTLENNQNRIEETILNTLNRLDDVENAILDASNDSELKASQAVEFPSPVNNQENINPAPVAEIPAVEAAPIEEPVSYQETNLFQESPLEQPEQETVIPVQPAPVEMQNPVENPDESSGIDGQFDIF